MKIAVMESSNHVQTFSSSPKKTNHKDFQAELQSYFNKQEDSFITERGYTEQHSSRELTKTISEEEKLVLLGTVLNQSMQFDTLLADLYPDLQTNVQELLRWIETEISSEFHVESGDFISIATSIIHLFNDLNMEELKTVPPNAFAQIVQLGKEVPKLFHFSNLNIGEWNKLEQLQIEVDELITRIQSATKQSVLQSIIHTFDEAIAKEQGNPSPINTGPLLHMLPRRAMKGQEQPIVTAQLETVNGSVANLNMETFQLQLNGKINEEATMRAFVREFSNILAKSSFSQGLHSSKLLIRLYPEQLGSLRVELLQRDGLMMARILTTTNSAKEMLDSQLHQLRQAFAQQNITVDKIEVHVSQQEQPNYLNQDRQNAQHQHHESEKENLHSNQETQEDFSETLNTILFESEV